MRVGACLLVLVGLLTASTAAAQEASSVAWQEEWPRFSNTEAVLAGGAAATALTFQFIGEKQDPWWTDAILADLPFRTWVGAKAERTEDLADTISDVTVLTSGFAPWVLSVGGAVAHSSGDVAGQLALITASAHSINLGVTNAMKLVIGRERPPLAACWNESLVDPDYECDSRPRVSFPSGHTSMAFTGAGLVCVFSHALPLYGDGLANDLPCIATLTTATMTAVLRVMANAHHLSDVIVGSGIGLASGWLLPWLVHFRADPETDTRERTSSMMPLSFGMRF